MTMKLPAPHTLLADLAATDSLNDKRDILKRIAGLQHEVFFEGCRLALDTNTMFNVKKVPEKLTDNRSELLWEDFLMVADALAKRDLTGHAALREITKIMDVASQAEWNGWYRRILQKNLKARFGVDLYNDALAGTKYVLPVFECMLAQDSKKKLDKVLTGTKAIEIKYDGVRVLSFYTPGRPIVCYSRNGKIFRNFTKVEQSLAALLNGTKTPLVLDGEMVSASFNSLMTQVNRKRDVQADDSLYVMFDILPQSEFTTQRSVLDYRSRRAMLETVIGTQLEDYDNLTITEPVYIDFAKDMAKYVALKKDVLEAGYEGLIVKDPDAVYECKRSKAWMKVKPFIEVTLTVVGVYEGEEGSEREGTFGGLICEGTEEGKFIQVRVGSGFSKEQIEDYWKNQKKLIGMKAEVRADCISTNKSGGYSLRFPRFKWFRGFKKGEKL